MQVVAWLCPHRFPEWRSVYRRTAAAADVLLVRMQRDNPLGLTIEAIDNGDPLFRGKQVISFYGAVRWTSSNWRQELCDRTRELLGSKPAIIQQFDEDEALSTEAVTSDIKRIEDFAQSLWYRFRGPLPSVDGFFDGFPSRVTYPAAPHCKQWRWFPEASFTRPKYQGYAAPCGIPRQPLGLAHSYSPHRIYHLLLATAELRNGRRADLTKYLQRANRIGQLAEALRRRPLASFEDWLTSIVGD